LFETASYQTDSSLSSIQQQQPTRLPSTGACAVAGPSAQTNQSTVTALKSALLSSLQQTSTIKPDNLSFSQIALEKEDLIAKISTHSFMDIFK
jgi:hypothetical protein